MSRFSEEWRKRWYVEMDHWFKEQAAADCESIEWDRYAAWCLDVGYAPTNKGWLAWMEGRRPLLARLDSVRERIGAFLRDQDDRASKEAS